MSEAKCSLENKEMEGLLSDDLNTVKKHDDNIDGSFNSKIKEDNHLATKKDELTNFMVKEEIYVANTNDDYKNKIRRKKRFSTKINLLIFRATQFLWYGAAGLHGVFLGIFLKQRGLTLVELSSVYSLVFLFQFIAGSVAGIITDKIGNAKPVLLFLMLSAFSVLVSLLLTPSISNISCRENLNFSNIQNFSSCYYCLLKNETPIQINENVGETSAIRNISAEENLRLIFNYSKKVCSFSNISLTRESFNLSDDDCCSVCEINTENHCINDRKQYLVAVYALLILAFYSVWNTTFRFINIVAISLAEKNDSHYGNEYAFAQSGGLLTMIIVAFVLNFDKTSGSQINFEPVIWIALGIMFCTFLTVYVNSVPMLPPGKDLMKKAFSLLKDVDIVAFILVVFVAGSAYSFLSIFHLVFLETLNAPRIVVSLHSIVSVLYAFPVVLTFKWWIRKFGANKLFVLSLLFYAVHNAAYSFIFDYWLSLVIDMTIAISFHLFWVTAVVHCWNVAPVGFAATLNAVTGSVHFGFGRSSGVFFGGMMMNYLGPRKAYRVMAVILFTAALLYSIFLYIRHKYPKVKVPVNGNPAVHTKCSENKDIQDAEIASKA